ncbi:MAG: hypothetical protein WCQ72_05915 [Eubacteriales bacterium]
MKMEKKYRVSALLLACLMLCGVITGCGAADNSGPSVTAAAGETTAAETTTEPDPLAGIDLAGETIRIYTSVNDNDATNANFLIEGSGEENGDVANDAVYARNAHVEDMLNVKLEFIQSDLDYGAVISSVSKIILSGDDVYDLMINDLFNFAQMSLQGMFANVKNSDVFDFEQNYWWNDYMKDLTIGNDSMFILAGDYFMDVLCSAHALYFNKDIMTSVNGNSDDIYNLVLDGKWTTDAFLSYISGAYQDLNGDSVKNEGDLFGYTSVGMWGSAIPFMLCGDIEFVSRDADGIPSLAMNNDRSVKTLEMLNKVFYNDASYIKFADLNAIIPNFTSGLSLFIGYQRISSFEKFRDTDFDVGIVPYPKLDEAQTNYVTATHDTTEIGVIPITTSRFDATCTTIEALCRSTRDLVLPAYYETSLKVKYARDDVSSQMLDIIHDNLRVAFPVAYNTYCSGLFLTNSFGTPLSKNSTDFASAYAKFEAKGQAALDDMVEVFLENNA